MSLEQKNFKFSTAVNKLLGSTVCLTLLFLVVLNYFSAALHPVAFVNWMDMHPLQISKSALRYKMEQLEALKHSPDVMVLGSSLPMSTLYYCDGIFAPFADKNWLKELSTQGLNPFQSYCGGRYLSTILTKEFKKPVEVFNFTGAACMISDVRLILSRSIESAKKPSMVILGVGLRDFVDNLMPETGETPSFQSLCSIKYLLENNQWIHRPQAIRELALSALFQYYRYKDEYRLLLTNLSCKLSSHPPDLLHALANIQTAAALQESKNKPAIAKKVAAIPNPNDLVLAKKPVAELVADNQFIKAEKALYRKRYDPPNYKRFAQEMNELKEIIDLCQRNDIKLVIVNMPITDAHKQLSSASFRAMYLSRLASITQKNKVTFFDFENAVDFQNSDFLDTVHTNAQGGKKFQDDLVQRLQSSHLLAGVSQSH